MEAVSSYVWPGITTSIRNVLSCSRQSSAAAACHAWIWYQVQDLSCIAFQSLSPEPGCIHQWQQPQFLFYFQEYIGEDLCTPCTLSLVCCGKPPTVWTPQVCLSTKRRFQERLVLPQVRFLPQSSGSTGSQRLNSINYEMSRDYGQRFLENQQWLFTQLLTLKYYFKFWLFWCLQTFDLCTKTNPF